MERLLTDKDFAPSDVRCLEVARVLRWPDDVRCPYCDSAKVWKVGMNPRGLRRYTLEKET